MGRAYIGETLAYGAAPIGPFDPTLGGTITPYMWYDFTDDATMEFSSANNIIAISSKGTNTGELRQSPTAGFTSPTWEGTYTRFYGGGSTHGKLSRRYSTDGTDGSSDTIFDVSNQYTTIAIFNPLFTDGNGFGPFVSIKSYNMNASPDAYNVLDIQSAAGETHTSQWSSTNTAYYPRIATEWWNGTDYAQGYSFSGATPAGWNSWVSIQNGSTSITSGRTLNNTNVRNTGNYAISSNANYENLVIGGRSRIDTSYAPDVYLSHVLFYDSILTTQNVDDVITNYELTSGITLNAVTN